MLDKQPKIEIRAPVEPREPKQPAQELEKGTRPVLIDTTGDPADALMRIARGDIAEMEELQGRLETNEKKYVDDFPEKGKEGLRKRYEQIDAVQISDEIHTIAIKPILEKRRLGMVLGGWEIQVLQENQGNKQLEPDIQKELDQVELATEEKKRMTIWQERMTKPLDAESIQLMRQALESQVKLLFLNKDGGSYNPDKYRSVKEQTDQFLNLLLQAQKEGPIPKDISSGEVFNLIQGNMHTLALQDRVASENLLGDHGVRHIIDHNIRVGMLLFKELQGQGADIRAIDQLIFQQAMIYHDLGYAMSLVRQPINTDGPKGQDAGHNVLAARYTREQFFGNNTVWQKIFGNQDFDLIHRAILYHDKDEQGKASIKFVTGKETQTPLEKDARRINIESAMRTADNTHAFEDKLPELLYRVPEAVKIMRLLRTAGEINDASSIDRLKGKLVSIINSKDDFSSDDKRALLMAAHSITPESYKFTVDRICGNKPEYRIADGKLHISVNVSEIHQEVVGLFDRGSYNQLEKMIKDVYGYVLKPGESPKKITSPEGHILEKREKGEKSDYQRILESLIINDGYFQDFLITDNRLRQQQGAIDRLKKIVETGNTSYNAEQFTNAEQALQEKRRAALSKALLFS